VSTTFFSSTPIWTRRIADELWSGPVTPLTFSLLAEPMAEHMVRRPLRTAGLAELAELPVLRQHASHVYVNAVLLAATIRLLPPGLRSEGLLALVPEPARARIGDGPSWIGGGMQAIAIAARAWRNEPDWAPWARAAAFDRECVEVRRGFQKRAAFGAKPSADDLRAELVRVSERLGRYLDVVSWGMVFAYVFFHLLRELCRQWAPDHADAAAALTIGLPGVASLEAHYDLRALAPLLAADPAVATALAERDAAAVLQAGDRPVAVAFRRFLEHHGHRLTGRDLSCPTWGESPRMVVELAMAARGDAALERAAVAHRRHEATAAIERAVGAGLAGYARGPIFALVLDYAQRYYALRENMRYHADFFLARLRQVALAFGADLVARGRLGEAADVFWLDVEELVHAAEGQPTDVAELVAGRRAAATAAARQPPPGTFVDGDGGAAPPTPPVSGLLVGECGAPGRSQGPARLVLGPTDFARVEPGDVLVAVYTDPGWTPVLERAAGLVLETGGILSHGAIVARELGIPALVGVHDATRVIRDGALVVLDASAGRVTIA
jgi:pyruvate,water dikinase